MLTVPDFRVDRMVDALRSRTAQRIGLVGGVAGVGFLIWRLLTAEGADGAIGAQTPSTLLVGLGAFGAFQVLAATALHALHGPGSARLWTGSQVIKYLPAPGSALVGMMAGAVRQGASPGRALRLTARHTALLVGGALVVGSAGLPGLAAASLPSWARAVAAVALAVFGVVVAWLSTRGSDSRWRLIGVAASVLGWAVLGMGLWALSATGGGSVVAISSAFALAWVVGLLALPVPAGLGVREGALLILLAPLLGETGAIAFGVVSRLLHMASDGLAAGVVFGLTALDSSKRPTRT